MNTADTVIVFVFLAAMFAVGAAFTRWVKSADDYYLAGRRLTPFILAAVLTATNVNLYSFIGQAGIAYREGVGILWQTWTGNMALVFSGLFVLPILRRLRIRTIPELLELRYGVGVRVAVAVLWALRLTFWLGVISYTAAVAAQPLTGINSFPFWLFVFSVAAIAYTSLGGMWSVAFTDVVQFVFMLAGALIVLPLAMHTVGWWPGLTSQLPAGAMTLVSKEGTYNWTFILAIFLLGIEWASVDQGLLQRAFGAESTRTVAQGLVLAGIITTPFALLWNIPGLVARVLHPGLANADLAIPTLLSHLLPNVVLGIVVCGLIASHLSTISANLNGVATIVTSDLYRRVFRREASERATLRLARLVTAVTGLLMMAFAALVPLLGSAVDAYLTVIAVMDMPLFVIAILYGLLWKRANRAGALTGYLAGSGAGVAAMYIAHTSFTVTTFISAAATLAVTPLASLLTRPPDGEAVRAFWARRFSSAEEEERGDVFTPLPRSRSGRAALAVFAAGGLLFLTGVLLGGLGAAPASAIAVGGMIIYFLGGLWRVYSR
jgi:solute:Na+ symporter, SSS family